MSEYDEIRVAVEDREGKPMAAIHATEEYREVGSGRTSRGYRYTDYQVWTSPGTGSARGHRIRRVVRIPGYLVPSLIDPERVI